MNETLLCEVAAAGNDLFCKPNDLLLILFVEAMLTDICLQIRIAILEKHVQIVLALLEILKPYQIFMLQCLQSLKFLFHSFYKIICWIALSHQRAFIYDFASVGDAIVFINVSFVCAREGSFPKERTHVHNEFTYLLRFRLLIHCNLIILYRFYINVHS